MLPWDAPHHVYILASRPFGVLYVGQTNDLGRRVWEHRNARVPGFTCRYQVKQLVWFEGWESRRDGFRRERQIKKWNRLWKVELIEALNPTWDDLGLRPEITRSFEETRVRWTGDYSDWRPPSP